MALNETAIIQWVEAIRTLITRKGGRITSIDLHARGYREGLIRWEIRVDCENEPDMIIPGMPTAQAALQVAQAYAEAYTPMPQPTIEAASQTTAFPGLNAVPSP